MKHANTILIALAVVVVGVYLVKRRNAATDVTVQAPAGAGSRGTAQENVPAFAGQGAQVPDNPFTAFLQGVQSYEWAMA